MPSESNLKFQLHHTGIKTHRVGNTRLARNGFQLHHTGIKTAIQSSLVLFPLVFQLHHTGIKTGLVMFFANPLNISIAPYRN